MKYTQIPGTDLAPSVICLGTALMGSTISAANSFALLDTYLDAGGNFLDTAHIYANWLDAEPSASEKTIGRWCRTRNNRDQIILATKGGHPDLAKNNRPRLSPDQLRTDLDESLTYLATDAIDLYWLHRDDSQRPVGEILDTLNDLIAAGKIRHIGCSNWPPHRIRQAQQYASKHALQGFVANQLMWSLAAVDPNAIEDKTMVVMDDESYALHKETQLTAVAYSSQAQGFFTKMQHGPTELAEPFGTMYCTPANVARHHRASELAQQLSVPTTAIALSYLISQPFPTIPVVGCRTVSQLTQSLAASDLTLPAPSMRYLQG